GSGGPEQGASAGASTPGAGASNGGAATPSSASTTPNNSNNADLSVIVTPGSLPGVPVSQGDEHHHHQQFNIFPAFFSKQLNFNHHQSTAVANTTKLMDDLRPNLSLLGVAGLVDDHHLHHHHHHHTGASMSPGHDRLSSDRIASLQEKIRKCGGGGGGGVGGEDFASLYQQPLQQHMESTPAHTPTHTPSPVVNRGIQDHTGESAAHSPCH
ncbi:POU domain, class 4, transcription factor 2-like, partial [Frankliniella occidentalis]|uniref:POU domain, class 4, transcription factor 2-like n=1 Tax=Frankliniella occidentalis TaxID=133901 RepID=A0A9C6XW04_FRAOC